MNSWRKIPNQKTPKSFLIKFLTEEHLFDFLDTGNIWFSRSDKFGDKMECVTINDLNKDPFPIDELTLRKQKRLISCWHNAEEESISMWDASYETFEKRRVYAIKFQYKHLVNYLKICDPIQGVCDLVYGKAIYQSLLNPNKHDNRIEISAFRKEKAFQYESEFRFVLLMADKFSEAGMNIKIGDVEQIDFSIMVNPLLKKRAFKYYESLLLQHELGRTKLKHSNLVDFLKTDQW